MDEGHERNISASEFQRFLDERGLEKPCAICGHNDWEIFVGGDGLDAPMTGYGLHTAARDTFIRTYPMVCQNCGNTILFATHIIRGWIERNG